MLRGTVELSDKQRAAIEDRHPVVQLVACAGSGKTEVLARRVVRALERGAAPESIIAFTFTEHAAAELRDRIERRSRELQAWRNELPPTAHGLFVGTIHAFALNLLVSGGGSYETFDVLPSEREWALVRRYAGRLGLVEAYAARTGRRRERVATAIAVNAFLASADYVYNERIPRERLRALDPRFAALFERYEQLLRDTHHFSFGSAIACAADRLVDADPLYEQLRKRIRHLFVDEYQNLNPAQETLVLALQRHAAGGRCGR